jgi:Mn2+/Fe2+ NRAMP family transporter
MTDTPTTFKVTDRRTAKDVVAPPRTLGKILRQVGPGLIIAANIVGSGELIMATKTGAEAGAVLLWLILLGCVVKVFVQLELGRFAISHGETTLSSLNRVPGPKVGALNWVVIFWAFMMLATIGQLGGIVGGVGQALALTVPITGDVQKAVRIPGENDIRALADWQLIATGQPPINNTEGLPDPASTDSETLSHTNRRMEWVKKDLDRLGETGTTILQLARAGRELNDDNGNSLVSFATWDDRIWVVIVGLLTSALLYVGRYNLIEKASVGMVVSFSLITIGNVIALQTTENYSLSMDTILSGLKFGLPAGQGAVVTALATFGIIGVGATELVAYPYWCLEKGYAKSTGPRDDSPGWSERAHGWFKVMKFDAFASMIIYTIATAAFYLMGVAVLHSDGRNPEGRRMVSTLAESYVPIFGNFAGWLFLGGAVAVLYSTYLVANASNSRMVADFLGVIGVTSKDPDSDSRRKVVTVLSTALPLVCVVAYLLFPKPVLLVLIAGFAQCFMLPVVGFSAMYFRYRETDKRLTPGKVWDLFLAVSVMALVIAGGYGIWERISNVLGS